MMDYDYNPICKRYTHTQKKKYEGKANPKNGCVRLIFSFSNLMNRKVTTPQQQL